MAATPVIQIAGVRDKEEALLLAEAGVTHIGFPLRLDYHREDVTETEAREIVRALPAEVGKVLITYLAGPREILDLADFLGVSAVQLHGWTSRAAVETLRREAGNLTIIRSLIVGRRSAAALLTIARSLAPLVDFFLTDSFDPETGASGATGKTHDWSISRRLVEAAGRPVILAGGLNAENVRDSILAVGPAGVDSHTGVERPDGRKDPAKVKRFVRDALAAFAEVEADS